ncbi:YbbR-like domain-containing protein [Pedobacter alpinus]|uniref:YbbR-like domain-containing protein n=1 Tax=Pedobacter alpinus TaxID=1590643 RepID=A0ABW5TUB1_9SPHI
MALIKLTAVERRKLSIFFTCTILAVLAWLFFSLSNKYEYEVKTVVNFKNLPVNKAFNPLQSDTVLLTVQGTGWQLLFTRLRIYPRDVKVDLKTLEKRNYVTFTDQMRTINNYYSSEQKIISVNPDTLYFDFTTRRVKKVPVKLVTKLSFVKQFGQSADIEIKPSFITVTGPLEKLATIKVWETDTFKRENISNTITDKISLKSSEAPNITIYPPLTELKIPVEEFTEAELSIPIKVINNQQYYNIKLIPERVKITFMVSLSDYAKVKEDDYEAIVDLDIWKNDAAKMLPVQIVKKRPFTRIRKIEPLQVNFMIKK